MREDGKRNITEADVLSIGLVETEEKRRHSFIGEVFDTITYPDGRVEKMERSFNIVVDSISTLIAALIKNDATYNGGSLYWAIGAGSTAWDTTPYTPVSSTTKLVSEVFRKAITSKSFVDASGNKVGTITNRLQLDITIDVGEANGYSLREFGIFGGNVSVTKDSGIMINHKSHSRIDKVDGMKIDRSVRFTF